MDPQAHKRKLKVHTPEDERLADVRKVSFLEGRTFERDLFIKYIRTIAKGQNPKMVGGILRQEFCRAIEEDLILGRHHEVCEPTIRLPRHD